MSWICCHLGAREHYAVPRALHRLGQLQLLATDAWALPGGAWTFAAGAAGRRLSERYAADLGATEVRDFTASLLLHEVGWRASGLQGWALAIARNNWFQSRAAHAVRGAAAVSADSTVVFAHSYAALEPFRVAKARGFTTVLGQIDPGQAHFDLVERLAERWPDYGPAPEAPPPEYFTAWREECALADWIVVNSEWSRDSLVRAGIAPGKLKVIPLSYDAGSAAAHFTRTYPDAFTASRPLVAIFIGSAAVYKGLPSLLEAMEQVSDLPIELRMVGETAATIPPRFRSHPAINWIGAVSRSDVMSYCRDADVMVFPSHSDGFGMVQVEAQGWRLPIIASKFCGRVVKDGVNGLLLEDVSASAIAAALRRLVAAPRLLADMAAQAGAVAGMDLETLGAALVQLDAAKAPSRS